MRRFSRWTFAALVLALSGGQPVAAEPTDGGQVVGVSLLPAPGKAELVIGIRGAVTVKDFVLDNPARIVLDLQGATLATPALPVYDGVARAGILNVRVRQNTPEVVRIVMVLDKERAYTVERTEESVRVVSGADDSFLAWSTGMPATPRAAAAEPAPAPVQAAAVLSDRQPPVRVSPVRLAQQRA
jgi:N-acetylmuramoyl-L-alanine amidase